MVDDLIDGFGNGEVDAVGSVVEVEVFTVMLLLLLEVILELCTVIGSVIVDC